MGKREMGLFGRPMWRSREFDSQAECEKALEDIGRARRMAIVMGYSSAEIALRRAMIAFAREAKLPLGLSDNELLFTDTFVPNSGGTPGGVVDQLFRDDR